MRLLVCGSRDWADAQTFTNWMESLHNHRGITVVIQGGADGADRMAVNWAKMREVPLETYAADWATSGKAAGPMRNKRMLERGRPDMVLAFVNKPLAESRGTAHMVALAIAAGVENEVVYADHVLH